jgi:hypothetical protein
VWLHFSSKNQCQIFPIERLILCSLRLLHSNFFAALNTNLFLRTRGPKVLQDEEIGWLSDAKVCVKVSKRFKAPLAHNSSRVYSSRTSKSIDCESKIYVFCLVCVDRQRKCNPKVNPVIQDLKEKKCCFVLLCRRKKKKGLMQLF